MVLGKGEKARKVALVRCDRVRRVVPLVLEGAEEIADSVGGVGLRGERRPYGALVAAMRHSVRRAANR